ncbi:MAG: signal peptide peptidase SppA [Bacteroidales bacterium]|nr:signal peptide peptidase SppA [Bacteroidales bacterium]
MAKFFKYLFVSFLGTLIAVLFFILVGVLILISVTGSSEQVVKENSVLVVSLDGEIADKVSHNPLDQFNPFALSGDQKIGLIDILKAIEKAEQDNNIKGIILKVDYVSAGISTLTEIRDALEDFKASGKFVLSYSDFYTQKAYYLSSVAQKVYMNPEGQVMLQGVSIRTTHFKSALEKLGIKPQIIRHGKYKSAVEIISEDKMSDASRYQMKEMIDDIWSHLKNSIAASRNIQVADIDTWADSLTIRNGKIAKEKGLIDEIKYFDEFLLECKDSMKIAQDADLNSVSLSAYINEMVTEEFSVVTESETQVAVIVAQGNIIPSEGDDESIGSENVSRMIRKARLDKNVRAIVLRVNSGGGSALASEAIWRECKLSAEQKTFVVSMGDAAASGGYYIAAPADYIVAQPTTITGSIGVFGVFFSGVELLNDLGITSDVVTSNANADMGTFARPLNPQEVKVMELGIEDVYQTFTKHVAEGRKKTQPEVDSVGQGRVWTGADALSIGLVDKLGGLKTALKVAIDMEGIADSVYVVKYYPEVLDPFSAIMKGITGNTVSTQVKETLGENYKYYKALVSASKTEGVLAKIPFDIVVE